MLREIQAEDRPATTSEQKVLARYSGWGALPGAFTAGHSDDARDEIRGLLSDAEYEEALQNTLNAHYTSPTYVLSMWQTLEKLGFTGGDVLDAGCGTGNFIGHAPATARMHGVERDSVSASIARLLYPNAEIRLESFGDTPVREGLYEAMIGNVPFGNYPVRDPIHNPGNRMSIHDHFIVKGLASLKPGGVLSVITSIYTLDKQDPAVRQQLAESADLLGAVRLPNGAHHTVAGTDVITDIVVLRKRRPSEAPGDTTWVESAEMTLDDGTEHPVNRYFHTRTHHIMGSTGTATGRFTQPVLKVEGSALDAAARLFLPLGEITSAAVDAGRGYSPAPAALPGETSATRAPAIDATAPPPAPRDTATDASPVSSPGTSSTPAASPARPRSAAGGGFMEPSARTRHRPKKVGEITHTGTEQVLGKRSGAAGSLRHTFTVVGFDGTEIPYVPKGAASAGQIRRDGTRPSQADELVDLLRLRDVVADLREVERETITDTDELDELRTELNRLYDTYVSRYGPITRMKPTLRRVKVDDPDDPNQTHGLVEGENGEWFERSYIKPSMGGIHKDPTWWALTGLEAEYDETTNTAAKAKLFTQRMLGYRELPTTADSPADAIAISREHDGRIDMDRIAGLLGVDATQADQAVKGLVFTDHHTGDLVPAHLYLSGNVRKKAHELEALAEKDPDTWGEAAAAMRAAVPADKDATQITVKLGMVWIPAADVQDFVRQITGNERARAEIKDDTWSVSPANGRHRNPAVEGGPAMEAPRGHDHRLPLKAKWGTRRRTTYQLVETALKGQRPLVEDETTDGRKVVNRAETEAAAEQMEALEAEFGRWVWRDPDRRRRLHEAYNDKYRSYTDVNYVDSPYATYPGMSETLELDPHQNDAVAMAKDSPAVLLHHEVGTGKTFTLAAIIMEKRRLGQIHKPVVVVPNHLLEQWVREFKILYPDADLLGTDTKSMDGLDGRRRFVAQAASHDWDAVIMTASAFRLLPLSEDTLAANVTAALAQIREKRDEAIAEGDTAAVKKYGAQIEKESARLTELQDRIGGDVGALDFETAGFDYVVVDEAHEYKNDEVSSSVRALAKGKPNLAAVDLRAKLDWLRERNAELGKTSVAAFATGTPVSNSTREFYVMARFLRPDLLAEAGVADFDDFRQAFLQMEESIEPTVTGRLQVKMREGDGLINAGELKRLWVQFADEVTAADVGIERPRVVGGQAEKVVEPVSANQQQFIAYLNYRREQVKPRFKPVKGEDTVVAIGTDGLTSAIDLRLIPAGKLLAAGIDPDTVDDTDSKVPMVAKRVLAEWNRTKDMRFKVRKGSAIDSPTPGALQLVFCDRGTPGGDDTHSFYTALKQVLVDGGIPADQVAFIHDADGDAAKIGKLSERCRNGEVKVLVGSTPKMGTGLNVQNRASMLHHVDGAYRPDQIEQRNGRIVRRGNQFDEVRLAFYPLEGSTEGFQWAHVARKDNFLRAFAQADLDATIIGQPETETQSEAAMLKALAANNPLMLDQAQLDLDLRRMRTQAATHEASREYHGNVISRAESTIRALVADVDAIDAAHAKTTDTSGEMFRMHIDGRTARTRPDAAVALKHALGSLGDLSYAPIGNGHPRQIGELAGLDVYAWIRHPAMSKAFYQFGVAAPGGVSYRPELLNIPPAEVDPDKVDHNAIIRLENLARSLPARRDHLTEQIARTQNEAEVSKVELDAQPVFPAADELAALEERGRTLKDLMRLLAGPSPTPGGPDASPTVSTAEPTNELTTEPAAGTGHNRPAPQQAASVQVDSDRPGPDADAQTSRDEANAAAIAEAETAYNEATARWRELRDQRLDSPGAVKPAEMGSDRTSRRRVKQQLAEKARTARGESATRPRSRRRDASADTTGHDRSGRARRPVAIHPAAAHSPTAASSHSPAERMSPAVTP